MNPVFLDLGIFKIYWYSITMLTAILVGSTIFYKEAKRQKFDEEFLNNLLFYGIIIGIVGARIYYVLFNLKYYMQNPIEIIEVWNGGLAIHGAIIAGMAWFIYYSHKHHKSPFKLLDIAVPGLLAAQAIGRWGNFFNQEAHGTIVTLKTLQNQYIPNFIIKGMKVSGTTNQYYIPTFYYEFLWNLLGFIIMLIVRKKKKLKTGQMTGIYFAWYSFGRFFIESMRTDSLMLGSHIRIAMLVSAILFIFGLVLIFWPRKDTRLNRLKERGNDNE